MARLSRIDRFLRITAILFAVLALAAPASMARPLHDTGGTERAVPATSLDSLSEAQILASRGQGAPRPITVAEPLASDGADAAAPAMWLIGIGVIALAAWTLTARRARATA
jgi:hypothetical protein